MNRNPVVWCTYNGDVRHILDEGRKGPNTLNEYLYPVTAEFDEDANKTRVGWSYLASAESTGAVQR